MLAGPGWIFVALHIFLAIQLYVNISILWYEMFTFIIRGLLYFFFWKLGVFLWRLYFVNFWFCSQIFLRLKSWITQLCFICNSEFRKRSFVCELKTYFKTTSFQNRICMRKCKKPNDIHDFFVNKIFPSNWNRFR